MDQPAGILSPEQLAHLLEQSSPETVPYWVIGAFAGLRSAELEPLEWKDIRFEPLKRLIRSPKRKELPLTAILEASVPFFGQSALAINRVRLMEKRPFAKI